jgi:glutamyl-tRNA reductase
MHNTADINDLVVAHWLKSRSQSVRRHGPGLFVDTCLRQLQIDVSPIGRNFENAEVRTGIDAYGFVLEITSGLRSAIPGETNVFGQFKNAWLNYRKIGRAADVARLAPLVHRLVNDTKSIRREHLNGIGGSSYGSLVRRLIAPTPGERVLFVGAGNLARSMWPLFRQFELGVWNRGAIDAPARDIDIVFRPDHGDRAAAWAEHVILTTPPDAVNDFNWRTWLDAAPARSVVHLGHRRGDGVVAWSNRIDTYDLDDVLALRRQQAGVRSRRLSRARAACRQHAVQWLDTERDLAFGNLKTA